MKKSVLLLIFILCAVITSKACSCDSTIKFHFCGTISQKWYSNGTIIQAVKIDQGSYPVSGMGNQAYMKVKILQTLKGGSKNDTIMVLGDNGAACFDGISQFKKNDTMILAFSNISDTVMLHVCGRQYLNYKNGIVSGFITAQSKDSMDYNSFKAFINNPPCLIPTGFENNEMTSTNINVFPNPNTNGIFYLNIEENFFPVQLKVFNMGGQLVKSELKSFNRNNRINLDLSLEPKGCYFIQATAGSKTMTFKVLKE